MRSARLKEPFCHSIVTCEKNASSPVIRQPTVNSRTPGRARQLHHDDLRGSAHIESRILLGATAATAAGIYLGIVAPISSHMLSTNSSSALVWHLPTQTPIESPFGFMAPFSTRCGHTSGIYSFRRWDVTGPSYHPARSP
nr:hypothetical protein CFP56_09909 [Quercus suber]